MVLCHVWLPSHNVTPVTSSLHDPDSYCFSHSDEPFATLRRNLRDSHGGLPQCPTDVGHLIGTASHWLQFTLQYHLSILENVLNTNLPYGYLAQRQEFVGVLIGLSRTFWDGNLGDHCHQRGRCSAIQADEPGSSSIVERLTSSHSGTVYGFSNSPSFHPRTWCCFSSKVLRTWVARMERNPSLPGDQLSSWLHGDLLFWESKVKS